jgi:hypothetical protein
MSMQEPCPDGPDLAARFRPRDISSLTASGLPKPARAIAQSACARHARVFTDRENPEDPTQYALDGNIT